MLKNGHKNHVSQMYLCPRFVATPCGQVEMPYFRHKKSLDKQGDKLIVAVESVQNGSYFTVTGISLFGSKSFGPQYPFTCFLLGHFKHSPPEEKTTSGISQSRHIPYPSRN